MFLAGAIACYTLFAQRTNISAPGAPGADAHWPSAAKNGFGTSNTTRSKVWFTLNNGVMTEVFYPTLDVPNVQMLQLIIAGGSVETESENTTHRLELVDGRALTFRQINTATNGDYTITKTYVTDAQRDTVLIDINFDSRAARNVYVYYDPSLNNSGMHDSAWTEGDALLAVDGDKASALVSSTGFAYPDESIRDTLKPEDRAPDLDVSNGYLGTSDGLTELKRNWNRTGFTAYRRADNGNVVQVAALEGFQGLRSEKNPRTSQPNAPRQHCTLALAFGKTPDEALRNARASLAKRFDAVRREYEAGWHAYIAGLPAVGSKYRRQFNVAAMVLKALEDKTYCGGIIASPSTPWGGGPNANEATISGYHAVWSRDLYQIATALYAAGDKATAHRALDYLFKFQQRSDGSFPQNTWIDGRPIGGGQQLDEVALPILLAYQFGRIDRNTWVGHIKPAADFIVRHGPATGQERWEEKPGYSAATIAAEIAGLVCAAHVARLHNDESSASSYLRTADDWVARVDRWTATSNGMHDDGHYYLRITEKGNPDQAEKIEINSGGGTYDQREIVDAGFLELVRLGIKSPNDPLIRKSIAVVDKLIKVETPGGSAWYRYNHDAYGEPSDGKPYDGQTGRGRLWTLLSGERGQFELAAGEKTMARKRLDAMLAFANEGLMIPEQVWDRRESPDPVFRFGSGTGSATPLAWSMAQFVRLAVNINRGRNIETPWIVSSRYLVDHKGKK